jgi:ribosomal protein L11 methyltransferase
MSNSKSYVNIYVKIYEEFYEILGSFLYDFPIAGIEEKLDEVTICIPADKYSDTLLKKLEEILKILSPDAKIIKTESLEEKNWNEEWEKSVTPIVIDDETVITPSWHAASLNYKHKILIDPKMSFGTGHHATTRLVCKLIKNVVKQDSFWIDAGTGTAVLAILAIKLGASRVFAFDNNIWSVENSIENIKMNNYSDVIEIRQADIFSLALPEADGIAANMYTHILKRAFPLFLNSLKKSNGDLLVSGVLKYDEDEIYEAATEAGFKHIETLREDEWIAVHFKPEL